MLAVTFFFFCKVMQSSYTRSLTIVQLCMHTPSVFFCFVALFFLLSPVAVFHFCRWPTWSDLAVWASTWKAKRWVRRFREHAVALWGFRHEPQGEQLYLSMWRACDTRPCSKITPRHVSIGLDLTYKWTLFNEKHCAVLSLPEMMREMTFFPPNCTRLAGVEVVFVKQVKCLNKSW